MLNVPSHGWLACCHCLFSWTCLSKLGLRPSFFFKLWVCWASALLADCSISWLACMFPMLSFLDLSFNCWTCLVKLQMLFNKNNLILNKLPGVGVGVEKLFLNLQMSVVHRILLQMDRWRVKNCITIYNKSMIPEGSLQDPERIHEEQTHSRQSHLLRAQRSSSAMCFPST